MGQGGQRCRTGRELWVYLLSACVLSVAAGCTRLDETGLKGQPSAPALGPITRSDGGRAPREEPPPNGDPEEPEESEAGKDSGTGPTTPKPTSVDADVGHDGSSGFVDAQRPPDGAPADARDAREAAAEVAREAAPPTPAPDAATPACPAPLNACRENPKDLLEPPLCVDFKKDVEHCGGCFQACKKKQRCQNGVCVKA